MRSELIGGLRLALLFPIFCCLVVIDEKARFAATAFYLLSIAAGAAQRRLPRSAHEPGPLAALEPIATPLLVLTVIMGLTVGAASTIGPAGAGIVIVSRALVHRELARTRPAFSGPPGLADQVVARLTVPCFILLMAPHIPGWPPVVNSHQIGGWLFMACGLLALGLLGGDLWRAFRTSPAPAAG